MSLPRRIVRSGAVPAWQVAAARPVVCCRRAFAATARQSTESTESTRDQPLPPTTPRDYEDDRPRWSYTPERMKAPFSLQQPKDPRRSVWKVNADPARLDRMYEKLLGRDLTRTLPDELKWLAVTHKSFDNGRRGFNTRLAFFGRMILALETTRTIMGSPAAVESESADPYGRQPFRHPALDNVDKLNALQPHHFASPDKLAAMAKEVGLTSVVRWKPRLPENLEGSGLTTVLASTVFAIVGAVALHHGGDVANRVVRERILQRLGA